MKHVAPQTPRLFYSTHSCAVRTTVRYFSEAGAPRDRAVFTVPLGTMQAWAAPLVRKDESDTIHSAMSVGLRVRRSLWAQLAQG